MFGSDCSDVGSVAILGRKRPLKGENAMSVATSSEGRVSESVWIKECESAVRE